MFSIQNTPKLAIIFTLLVYTATNFSHHNWTRDKGPDRGVIIWDVVSYYAYLPATVIYRDLSLDFVDEPGFVNDNKFWYQDTETGGKLIITSMGMSYLYAPFFFIAHILAPVFKEPRNGFNSIYQFFLVFSSLFYAGAGLIFLRRILLKYFGDGTAAFTILLIGLGTNLYQYATFDAPMSHSYSFSLITIFLLMTIRWYENAGLRNSFLTGLLFGLITLVRPTNILVLLIFLLWGVNSVRGLKNRFFYLTSKSRLIAVMAAGFLIPWIPQFLYWEAVTGHFLFYSYGTVGSRFFFGAPHIAEILFSFRKGWFIYTPIMLFAFIGLFLPGNNLKEARLPVSAYMVLMIYVQASWWTWWFGGGFGSRVFIDTYGIMALPLAAFINHTFRIRSRTVSFAMTGCLLLLMSYQVFQTFQYRNLSVHWEGMTWEAYRENFMKLRTHGRYWQLLSMPDYELATKGIYVYYKTGEDISFLEGFTESERIHYIEQKICEDGKLMKEISRYANRSNISREDAIGMVAQRMYEQKMSLHGMD